MFNTIVRKDVNFSRKHQEFHVITDPEVTVQDALDEYCKMHEASIYPHEEFVIIETDYKAYALLASNVKRHEAALNIDTDGEIRA